MFRFAIIYLIAAFIIGFWPFDEGLLFTSSLSPFQYTYDQGYEDGYEGAGRQSRSSPYADGYDDGDYDSECDWLKEKKKFQQFRELGCGE